MKIHRFAPVLLAAALAALVGLGVSGCNKGVKGIQLPNLRPVVRLTAAPVDTTGEYFYLYRLNWVGYDPDGRVAYYEFTVDPPTPVGSDTVWTRTTKTDSTFKFDASTPDNINAIPVKSKSFHVFVLRAVDNQGARSENVTRAFFSFGVAPTVEIDTPKPNALIRPVVPPAVRISWTGKDFIDPNGALFEKPIYYKYKLFKLGPDIPYLAWFVEPDSLRRTYAPNFDGWQVCSPDSPYVQFTNLVPESQYLFVVVAFARSGAYSPVFDLNSNMLVMSVGFASSLGPIIHLWNEFFDFRYASGGFPSPLDPKWAVQLQVPGDQPLTFNWLADPPPGSAMRRYRWVLDLQNLDDETERSSQSDWYHWSPWSLATTTATIGPFAGSDTGEVHNFYVEAEDVTGLVSLGWVQFSVFRPTFNKELLIVKDYRYGVDMYPTPLDPTHPDSMRAPTGVWPDMAEADTFLFAVGGVRWKMTPNGTLSPKGIFREESWPFDTLGTRYGKENPTIPLSLLGSYKRAIWMTDALGALNYSDYNGGSPTNPIFQMTTLFYMCSPNRQNTLSTWVQQGGLLWACGGGFGSATNIPWNNTQNDQGGRIYTTIGARPDLTPGRFMYDLVHWRSEWRPFGAPKIQFVRFDRPDPLATALYPYPQVYWKGGVWTNPAGSYSSLPTSLRPKAPATDPIWPFRNPGDFYVNNARYSSNPINFEYMHLENYITELFQSPTNPDSTYELSTLDTLYLAYGNYANMFTYTNDGAAVNPVMTVYHGSENPMVVYTGHDIMSFNRSDLVSLVKFVLNQLWNMPHVGSPAFAAGPLGRPVQQLSARGVATGRATPGSTAIEQTLQKVLGRQKPTPTGPPTFMRLR